MESANAALNGLRSFEGITDATVQTSSKVRSRPIERQRD